MGCFTKNIFHHVCFLVETVNKSEEQLFRITPFHGASAFQTAVTTHATISNENNHWKLFFKIPILCYFYSFVNMRTYAMDGFLIKQQDTALPKTHTISDVKSINIKISTIQRKKTCFKTSKFTYKIQLNFDVKVWKHAFFLWIITNALNCDTGKRRHF